MILPDTEEQLAVLAAQMAGGKGSNGPASARQIEALRAAIGEGDDPLGDAFIRLRSAAQRRTHGAIYTPRAIVDAMIAWAANEPGPPPARIVDPGSGSGRFLIAAARAFPAAQLVAVEVDPLAVRLLRANACVSGFADRLSVHVADYRTCKLARIRGRTLFIGNPPYVRHHQISEEAKDWFGETAQRLGLRASKLAGLHMHFFLRTRQLAKSGDLGVFITSSEWLDVNYGSLLREMLVDGLGGTALHVLDPAAGPFAGTLTTGVIACFRVGNRPEKFSVRAVRTLGELAPLAGGTDIGWDAVKQARRWSTLARPTPRRPSGVVELGELFRVHRGQVTGCNAAWIAGPQARDVPQRFLVPSVTRAREIFACAGTLRDTNHLRCVVDLPVDLDALTATERLSVNRFLKWAKTCGADQSYVAHNRRAWWAVGMPKPPPIICTYMARKPPAFVRNTAGASLLNIAHGLYPLQPMTEAGIAAILAYLRESVSVAEGRSYAGGLVKFEPREVERLYIPSPDVLCEHCP
jgi:methylase of polypeptide subunit release factors